MSRLSVAGVRQRQHFSLCVAIHTECGTVQYREKCWTHGGHTLEIPSCDRRVTNIVLFCAVANTCDCHLSITALGCHLTNTSLFDQIMVSCPSPDQHFHLAIHPSTGYSLFFWRGRYYFFTVASMCTMSLFCLFLDRRLTNISLLDPQLCP